MSTLKVIIDYSDLPEGELDNFAQTVHDKLSGNTNFTFDAADLTSLQALITDYAPSMKPAVMAPRPTRLLKTQHAICCGLN